MSVIKVAILGFGTVGEGVYRTIDSHADELKAVLGKKVEVTAILIKNKHKERNISPDVLVTSEFNDILQLPQLDVVVEAIVDKEPTFTFLRRAIEKGCHIITANKEMFAHHGEELLNLAEKNKVSVGYEATVAGGIPIIQTVRQLLKINRVHQFQGILNGTSNFILTEMREKKQSFAEALLLAQQNGFAEADPTNDVEGFDAFFKTMILSRLTFGEEPAWQNVEFEGITSITSELIEAAGERGLRFKHLAKVSKVDQELKIFLKPALVSPSHPFYHVEGVQNAVHVQTDIVGGITLQGPGAGMFPTASAVIEDLVYVCQNTSRESEKNKSITIFKGQNKENTQDLWLLKGNVKKNLHPEIKWMNQTDHDIHIVEASEKDVDRLISKNKGVSCYPILGEFELKNREKYPSSAVL